MIHYTVKIMLIKIGWEQPCFILFDDSVNHTNGRRISRLNKQLKILLKIIERKSRLLKTVYRDPESISFSYGNLYIIFR